MVKFKRYICFTLVLLLTVGLFGCSRDVDISDAYLMKISDNSIDVLLESEDKDIFCDKTQFKDLVRVSKSDMFALCFSEESYGISVYDSGSNTIWRSLPESLPDEKTGVICLTLLIDGNEYTLNSQSDSKAMNCTSYEIKEDSIVINYSFKRTFSDGTKIDITVPCEYRGFDGTMSVSIDCSDLVGDGTSENVVVKSVSVLPYLGANKNETAGDFILIPDGSGAVIDTSAASEQEELFVVDVYSDDPAKQTIEGAYATVPAFGMKVDDGAFVAVIEEGDAISRIKAHKASLNGGYNRVYAEFEITPTVKTEEGYYVSSVSYGGQLKLSYRFISKENTDYVGMATVCRELLIRNGSLTSGNIDKERAYPFNLSLIGVAGSKVYTDFAQCYDILSALKGKGINSINLRYRGILGGGIEQENAENADFNDALDEKAAAEELNTLVSSQGINVYTDLNIFSFSKTPDDRSLDLKGNGVKADISDFIDYKADFCGASSISNNVNTLLHGLLNSSFTGLCLNDGGYMLYSDFSKGEVSLRSDIEHIIFEQANAVSATKKLMVKRGNLYAIKYADVIIELPETAYYADGEACTQVPFIQAVLHGVCDYSLSAINLSENSTDSFLKAIEYGAMPYYEWYHEDKGKEDAPDSYYYLNSIAEAQQQYDLAREAFKDLSNAKITAHSQVADGVYLTVYDNETEIYVNYGQEAVTVSGVTVEAESFIRVN